MENADAKTGRRAGLWKRVCGPLLVISILAAYSGAPVAHARPGAAGTTLPTAPPASNAPLAPPVIRPRAPRSARPGEAHRAPWAAPWAATQEGPLANDTFLPVDEAASAAFARGDEHYLTHASGGAGGASAGQLERAFDAWRDAVAGSPVGAAVPPPGGAPWAPGVGGINGSNGPPGAKGTNGAPGATGAPGANGTPGANGAPGANGTPGAAGAPGANGVPGASDLPPRHSLGVEEALLLRLEGLPSAQLARFAERFSGLANAALEAALRREPAPAAGGQGGSHRFPAAADLAALERAFPATEGAVRAALALADGALERARRSAADTWLRRAARNLALASAAGPSLARLTAAIERRRRHLEALSPPAPPEAWTLVDGLRAGGSLSLTSSRSRGRQQLPIRGNVQPGMTALADGTLVVQVQELAFFYPPGRQPFAVAPRQGLHRPDHPLPPESGTATTGRWPLYPLALYRPGEPLPDRRQVVLLVAGRSASRGDNALLAMELSAEMPVAMPRWTFSGSGGQPRGTRDHSAAEALGPGRWEWEPGPLLLDDLVLVQARQASSGSASVKSWLVALERETGAVAWKLFLAKGAPLRGSGRGAAGVPRPWSTPMPPGQPLASVAGAVFCGSNLGSGSLVDATDGRLRWTLKNRRASSHEASWKNAAPPPIAGRGPERRPVVIWTPTDSDRLYELSGTPGPGPTTDPVGESAGPLASARSLPFCAPPRPRGEAEELVGADGERLLFLGRSGARLTLSLWESNGRRADSLYLGRGEAFTGTALSSSQRTMFATGRGLYLFDTSSDPSLIQIAPLDDLDDRSLALSATGGTVFARGQRVWVLAPGRLDEFQVMSSRDE